MTKAKVAKPEAPAKGTKLDQVIAMLRAPDGVTIAEISTATGWQAHSVRGAMAGTLKKKGHVVTSTKAEGLRRYRLEASA